MERSTSARRHIDGGRLVTAVGGLLLLIGLFLDWYGTGGRVGEAVSAFAVFEIADLLLAALAIAAILIAVEPFAGGAIRIPSIDTAFSAIGPVAFLMVVVSIVNQPPAAREAEIEVGAWLSLAGAAIMCAGALLAMNRISLVVTPRERPAAATPRKTEPPPRASGPGGDPPPETEETRPL